MQYGASLVAQMIKNLPAMQETWVQSLGQEDPVQQGMVTHSSILAWRIPWTRSLAGYKESDTTEQLSLSLENQRREEIFPLYPHFCGGRQMQTLSPAVKGTEKLALMHVQIQVTQGGHHPGRTKRGEEHSPRQALQRWEGVAEKHRCCGGRALRRSRLHPRSAHAFGVQGACGRTGYRSAVRLPIPGVW